MEKDKTNEVCSLIDEFIQELKMLPPKDYLEIKLMLLASNETNWGKSFLKKVFYLIERQRPLLIGTRDKTSESDGGK